MKENCFFITGTDTNAGKTWATLALMNYFKAQGKSVAGMKPVASGCQLLDGQFKNADALQLQANASMSLPYDWVNPYAYELPVAPHFAAGANCIDLNKIAKAFSRLQENAEIVLVEGVGGWLVPLSGQYDIADLVKYLKIKVILAVGIKLGCINHARMTWQAMQLSGVKCIGWIAICVDSEMLYLEENIEALKGYIGVPMLGICPNRQAPEIHMALNF